MDAMLSFTLLSAKITGVDATPSVILLSTEVAGVDAMPSFTLSLFLSSLPWCFLNFVGVDMDT